MDNSSSLSVSNVLNNSNDLSLDLNSNNLNSKNSNSKNLNSNNSNFKVSKNLEPTNSNIQNEFNISDRRWKYSSLSSLSSWNELTKDEPNDLGELIPKSVNIKKNLFLDVDDVILNSSEAVISILNERYSLNPPKTISDLQDWGYKSICRRVTSQEIVKIYESEEFWEKVQIKKEALIFLQDPFICNNYHIVFITKSNLNNVKEKEKMLYRTLLQTFTKEYQGCFVRKEEGIKFLEGCDSTSRYFSPRYTMVSKYGEEKFSYVLLGLHDENKKGKKEVDMEDCVQIDDNVNYLNTNAKYKIIYKNHLETLYNQAPINSENYYNANTFEDILSILKFIELV